MGKNKFRIKMKYGSEWKDAFQGYGPMHTEEKEFKTREAAEAYLEGIGDSDGWENIEAGDIIPPITQCGVCGSSKIFDITHSRGNHRNIICFGKARSFSPVCHGHYWKGKWYTSQDWDKWLEEVDNVDNTD